MLSSREFKPNAKRINRKRMKTKQPNLDGSIRGSKKSPTEDNFNNKA